MGYETVREAEAAIQRFDGFDLGQGARLKVALALTKQKPNITDPKESEPIVNSTACNGVPESTKEGASIRYEGCNMHDLSLNILNPEFDTILVGIIWNLAKVYFPAVLQ